MNRYYLLMLLGTFAITQCGDLELLKQDIRSIVKRFGASNYSAHELLKKQIKSINSTAVQNLLDTESFTPKEMRAAYKLAHEVSMEYADEKRTKWEWLKMLVGGFAATCCFDDLIMNNMPNLYIVQGTCNLLLGYWISKFAYNGWRAPYERFKAASATENLIAQQIQKKIPKQ